jgi:hypothetical protein
MWIRLQGGFDTVEGEHEGVGCRSEGGGTSVSITTPHSQGKPQQMRTASTDRQEFKKMILKTTRTKRTSILRYTRHSAFVAIFTGTRIAPGGGTGHVCVTLHTCISLMRSAQPHLGPCACEANCKRIGYSLYLTNFLFRVLFSVHFYKFP